MLIGIIPDIHNKAEEAQSIVDELKPLVERIVMLGDYVDDFDDDHRQFYQMLKKIGEWQRDPQIITLMGNHEASYMVREARCKGWTHAKQEMWWMYADTFLDTRRLLACHHEGDVLFTHAGLAEGVDLAEQVALVEGVRNGKWAAKLDYHPYDGGSNKGWSILTGRFGYGYKRAVGQRQIHGHTPKPRVSPEYNNRLWQSINFDTELACYGILNLKNHVVEVYDSQLKTLVREIDDD